MSRAPLRAQRETMKQIAKKELGDDMAETVKKFKDLIQQTPVEELDIKEYPFVVFRVNANTWIEVSVTYLVHPKKASQVRSRLIKSIANGLLREPDRVMFPKSNSR